MKSANAKIIWFLFMVSACVGIKNTKTTMNVSLAQTRIALSASSKNLWKFVMTVLKDTFNSIQLFANYAKVPDVWIVLISEHAPNA